MNGGIRKWGAVASAIAASLALALPSAAAAADRYVDDAGSDTGNDCTETTAPCATIAYAVTKAAPGERVLVDNGTYNESVSLSNGVGLAASDFVPGDGSTPTIIDGGTLAAITVAASGAGSIRGLVIESDASEQVVLNGPAELESNAFPDVGPNFMVGVKVNAPGSEIHGNSFTDIGEEPAQGGIGVYAPGAAVVVRENVFSGMELAVQVAGPTDPDAETPTTVVARNLVTGGRGGRSMLINSTNQNPMIARENVIRDPSEPTVDGIHASGFARLVRNDISEHQRGVFVGSDETGVTLEGDRIWGNGDGLYLHDTGLQAPVTSVAATNVTIYGNNVDIRLSSSSLVFDSSLIGDVSPSGSSCEVTYSRADPAFVGGDDPNGCDGFQTDADPLFANAAAGDFHLLPDSPMIDAGNPADPGAAAVDFDDDPRALDATPECEGNVPRRDIGADEFVPAVEPDCQPPVVTLTKTPPKKLERKRARFGWVVDEEATYECKLDKRPREDCTDPVAYKVKPGRHVFKLWATDLADNAAAPVKYAFRRVNPRR